MELNFGIESEFDDDVACRRYLDSKIFKINRNNKEYNICFSDLTEEEMNTILESLTINEIKELCITLGKSLRKAGDQLDFYGPYAY